MSDSKADVSAIDKAIAAARARKAAKGGDGSTNTNTAPKTPKADKGEATPKRPRLTDEEKAAREETRNAERASKKEARDAARAAKRAERETTKRTPHMSKVAKAAAKLPALNDSAQVMFNDITTNFSRDQVNALSQHLQHFNRVKATERALGQKVEVGDTVRIVGGDPRWIGKTGTIAKAQRIRCYVEFEGHSKVVYFFISDVEQVSAAATAQTA